MLLPSDVARLVLGYLQEEGLSATSQAFIHESSNLKEYAEHTTADGTIPACVFSVFGKGLTTILNEYVAAKAKESCHEVPAMMTSLWKKLDFTLNQIKSLQNSPAISASQRTRSRIGVANMARQRALTMASAGAVICSSVSETSSIISPAHTCHSMLGHSTPMSYTGSHTRPASAIGAHQQINDGGRLLSTPRDSPVQIIVSEHRLNPGPMSPGRRKWDTPRKRGGGLSGSSGSGRAAMAVSSLSAEPQAEEVVDENFPQLVIQNARDKILGDRSLQEKLAENINKILANEPTPQTSKASSNTVEADQSIDEILGLQGEIHMSDDAIHDILEQTESDPAFQALFDLFDYNRTRSVDGEPGDADISSSPEETDSAVPSSTVKPLQSDDPGATHRDTSASDTTSMTLRKTTGQERKTRKNTAPSLVKKTVLGSSGRASRIENSSARLLVSHGEHRGVSAATTDPNRKEAAPLFPDSAGVTPMDIDEPLITPPPPLDSLGSQEPASKDSTSTTATLGQSTTVPAAFAVLEEMSASHVDKRQEQKQAERCKEQPAAVPSSVLSNTPAFLCPVQLQLNNSSGLTANLPPTSVLNSGGETLPVSSLSIGSVSTTSASAGATFTAASSSGSAAAPLIAMPGLPTSVSTPATPKSASSTSAADSSNVVSLKIIISDNQDENSSSDAALNQAISSISSDKIPTIYLSSPAKSPALVPGTPKVNFDEVAQAVSGLQNSEVHASPLGSKAGAVIASPLTGTSQAQQSYIIQLPLDSATPALQGTTASYFLVADTQTTDAQTRQVLLPTGVSKGQPLSTNQFGVNTPNCSQSYATGSALILPSPVKPMMLPVSVVGQNTPAKVPMVSNQLVTVPNPTPVQQTVAVKTKPSSVATRQSAAAGTEKNVVGKLVQPASTDNAGQQDASKGPSHRRILCFEPSAETQPQTAKTIRTATPMAPNTSTSQSVQQTEKSKQPVTRTKPNILTGNKPKRRVETIRCSADPQTGVTLAKQSVSLQQPQKEPVNKNFRKQDHNIHNKESPNASASSVDASQPRSVKTSESRRRSKSNDRKHQHDKSSDEGKAKEAQSSRSLSCDSALKSGSRKDKEESSRKEPAEKAPVRPREGRPEKRTPSQEVPNVTANKENEMKGSTQEQPQHSAPSSSASRDFSPPAAAPSTPNPQPKASKATSKTSSLAKQAAEMLQDIQGLNSPSTPVKRPGASSSDLSLPGTGHNQEAPADCPKTPSRQKKGKDGEATPKHLLPPNTPDVPTCSPASEAGSENSINMAAHTLMILSRAAIARTGTPLKDSLRQEGVGEKSPTSSKSSKKRKQTSPTASPPAKKESKLSPSKKKDREKKKLVDCFPHDLDVDKFLSSLHYDE